MLMEHITPGLRRNPRNAENPPGHEAAGGFAPDSSGEAAYDFGLKSKFAVTGAPAATVMS